MSQPAFEQAQFALQLLRESSDDGQLFAFNVEQVDNLEPEKRADKFCALAMKVIEDYLTARPQ